MGSVAVGGGGREERAAEGSSQPGVWGMNTKINSGREQSSGPRRSSNTNHCPSGSNWPTAKSLVIKREKETSAALPASASFPVFLLLTVARKDRRQRLLGAGRPHQILKHGAGQSESSRTGGKHSFRRTKSGPAPGRETQTHTLAASATNRVWSTRVQKRKCFCGLGSCPLPFIPQTLERQERVPQETRALCPECLGLRLSGSTPGVQRRQRRRAEQHSCEGLDGDAGAAILGSGIARGGHMQITCVLSSSMLPPSASQLAATSCASSSLKSMSSSLPASGWGYIEPLMERQVKKTIRFSLLL